MSTTLKTGDKAPDFTGINEKGEKVSLNDYKGKKLVLFFYPKDMTPGCTLEACNLRDNYTTLKKAGFEILGVSVDDEKKHTKFIEKYDLPFSLLADTGKEIVNAYGVWGPKSFMGRKFDGTHRVTFIIDEAGTVKHIIDKVSTKDHAAQILELN
jgi:thioredoxin-dependent peroxiredoxin